MNKKKNDEKERWHSNAIDITMDSIDRQLYRNGAVDDFINHKSFIIAEKGIGKTLLLKKKKYDLLKKNNGLFIPENPELDFPDSFDNLSANKISFLESDRNTKSLWQLAIQLSAVKKYYFTDSILPELEKDDLPVTFIEILKFKELNTPSEFFTHIIYTESISEIMSYFTPPYSSKIRRAYTDIRSTIYIFIDRLDQAMLNSYSQAMWLAMPNGLLQAAWDLNEWNHHIKIFCSIRKEAYVNFTSEIKGNISGKVCILKYNENELHELVNTLSLYYESGKTIEQIVGFNAFTSPSTGNEETVFGYILRHTVSRPRDLIRIAYHLCDEFDNNDTTDKVYLLRKATNEKAKNITEEIFNEQARFLECLQSDRNKFLSLIPRNILNQEIVDKICKTYNNREEQCTREQCLKSKSNGGCKHPFCELYNIGLLGYARRSEPVQKFKNIDDDGDVQHLTSNYEYYIIHPSLYEIIHPLHANTEGGRYVLTPGITTGNGRCWTERERKIAKLMDVIFNTNLPKNKIVGLMEIIDKELKESNDVNTILTLVNAKMEKLMKKLFLSYSWKNKSDVDIIDGTLQGFGLKITRDERNLVHKMNIKEFMSSLQEHDFVITVISDSYLKSKNCLYEIGELLKKKDFKRKTLQIILPDARIFDTVGKYEYLKYWNLKKSELQEIQKDNLSAENINLISLDIKEHDDIITNLPRFIEFILSERGFLYSNLITDNYKSILDYIENEES